MSYRDLFSMPYPVKITGRVSSITNSFVNGIAPCIQPNEEEISEALSVLGMDESHFSCAYCGDPCTEWDHLNPLVLNKQPTGYCSEIHNLVPSCGKCNQSKGNKHWRDWMLGPAAKSPATRGVADLAERVSRLDAYCETFQPIKLDFKSIVGETKWAEHWKNHADLILMMRRSQVVSDEIRHLILSATPSFGETAPFEMETTEHVNQSKIADESKAIKVGEIVKQILAPYIQSSICPQEDIELLSDPAYSKDAFGVSFPIILQCTEDNMQEKRLVNGRPRYYADALVVNGQLYLLTKEWKARNKQRLTEWLESRGVIVESGSH